MEAILVAGGQGKRLGDAARGRPKALVEIAGRPLSSYMVERLAQAGVRRVVVNCARGNGDLFRDLLSGRGARIVVAEEPESLGRGGGVRFASQFLKEEGPFYVVYGDELIDVDFRALMDRHRAADAALTVTAAPLTTPFGVLEMDELGQVDAFQEGPTLPDHWVNVGVYVMSPQVVLELPERGDAEHDLFPRLAAQGRLFAHRHTGVWLTVNTAKDLERANSYLRTHPRWPNEKRQTALQRDLERALRKARPFRSGPRAHATVAPLTAKIES